MDILAFSNKLKGVIEMIESDIQNIALDKKLGYMRKEVANDENLIRSLFNHFVFSSSGLRCGEDGEI